MTRQSPVASSNLSDLNFHLIVAQFQWAYCTHCGPYWTKGNCHYSRLVWNYHPSAIRGVNELFSLLSLIRLLCTVPGCDARILPDSALSLLRSSASSLPFFCMDAVLPLTCFHILIAPWQSLRCSSIFRLCWPKLGRQRNIQCKTAPTPRPAALLIALAEYTNILLRVN